MGAKSSKKGPAPAITAPQEIPMKSDEGEEKKDSPPPLEKPKSRLNLFARKSGGLHGEKTLRQKRLAGNRSQAQHRVSMSMDSFLVAAYMNEDKPEVPAAERKAAEGESKEPTAAPASPKPTSPLRAMQAKRSTMPKMNPARRMKTMVISKEENHALVFIKPSAAKVPDLKDIVEQHFLDHKCELTSEGVLTAEEIVEKGLIDHHYAALAKNAMDLDPAPRVLEEKLMESFAEKFHVPYDPNLLRTLGQLMRDHPSLTPTQIDAAWSKAPKLKLAGGLYIGRLEALEAEYGQPETPLIVVNGFYAAMRSDYVTPGNCLVYFTVEWKEKDLSWKEFRRDVVGATDPAVAEPTSLRAKLRANWQELGLKSCPSIQDNCIHASAGPIEAMRERSVWIGMPLLDDPFAMAMLNDGIDVELIESWCRNGVVTIDGRTAPAFDIFEDLDSSKVMDMAGRVEATRRQVAESFNSDMGYVSMSFHNRTGGAFGSGGETPLSTSHKRPAADDEEDEVVEKYDESA